MYSRSRSISGCQYLLRRFRRFTDSFVVIIVSSWSLRWVKPASYAISLFCPISVDGILTTYTCHVTGEGPEHDQWFCWCWNGAVFSWLLAPDNKLAKLLSDKLMSGFDDKEWYISAGNLHIVSRWVAVTCVQWPVRYDASFRTVQ